MTLEILANAAIRLMLLAAAAWLLLRAFRVRNAHAEALVWRSMLLAGFALPALLYWQVAPSFTTSMEPLEIVAAIPGATLGAAPVSTGTVSMIVASIYLAVASLLLVRLLAGLAVMWRISRAARPMPMPDDVRISERVRSPATFGAVILLPPEARAWPVDKLGAVLAHERSHVRSGDAWWSWLARLHAALFWFSPFAWWIQRRLEALAETSSDDAVLIARHDPADYAALLLEFARQPNRRSVAMSVAESNVSKRIERLLARTPPAAPLPRVARWTALILMIPLVVFAASTTSAASEGEPPAPSKAVRNVSNAVSLTRPADPDAYYPAVAKEQNVTGFAVVEVDVDASGQLVDARVVEVQPADPQFGFGDAALQVARNSRYANTGPQVGTMKFKVKFDLQAPAANAAPAMVPKTPVRITRVANPDDFYPRAFYPNAAKREKVAGEALVEVAVDPSGKVVNVAVSEVLPADPRYGFARAAERVARANGYSNPTEEVATIKFKVKFSVKR